MVFKRIIGSVKALLPILVLFASGCISNYANISAAKITEGVNISNIKKKNQIHYVGPTILREETYSFDTDYNYYYLQSWRDRKTGTLKHQFNFRIANTTGKYRNYTSAAFDNGQLATMTELRRYERCRATGGRGGKGGFTECFNEQTMGVSLTDASLKTYAEKGFTLQVNAEGGHKSHINLPAEYIRGYLKALEITEVKS